MGLAGCTGDDETEFEGEIRLSLAGMTADSVSLQPDSREIESAIATELGVRARDVRSRPGENTIEVLVDVDESAFRSALDAAGLDVLEDQIADGVTEQTREETVEVLTARLEQAGFGDASVEVLDEGADRIGIDLPDDAGEEPDGLRTWRRSPGCWLSGHDRGGDYVRD